MIAGQDQVVLRVDVAKVARRLPHGIGGPLKPLLAFRRLLGGEHFDEPVGEQIQPVRLRHVAVERGRVELRQHVDAFEPGVQAVADRNVDEPVLASDGDRRLRSVMGEGKQARAAATAEHDRQDVIH